MHAICDKYSIIEQYISIYHYFDILDKLVILIEKKNRYFDVDIIDQIIIFYKINDDECKNMIFKIKKHNVFFLNEHVVYKIRFTKFGTL